MPIVTGLCLLWSLSSNDSLMVTSSHRLGLNRVVIQCIVTFIILANNSGFIPKISPTSELQPAVQREPQGKGAGAHMQSTSLSHPPSHSLCHSLAAVLKTTSKWMEGKEVSGYVWKYSHWLVMGSVASWASCSLGFPALEHYLSFGAFHMGSLEITISGDLSSLSSQDKREAVYPSCHCSCALVPSTPLHSDFILDPTSSLTFLSPSQRVLLALLGMNKQCVGIQLHATKLYNLIHATTWMELKDAMPSGKSQSQKVTYCLMSLHSTLEMIRLQWWIDH